MRFPCFSNVDGELVRVSGASGNNAGLFRNNAESCLLVKNELSTA